MELPHRRHDLPEPKSWLRLVGPGAIMVATSLGSGEIYFWPHLSVAVGACVLLLGLGAIWLQYVMNTEISRYTLTTGETILRGFDRLWRPLPWIILACCTLPWIWPGWAMGASHAATWLVGGNAKLFGVGSLLLAGVLLSVGRTLYKSLETTQIIMIVCMIVGAVAMFFLAKAYLAATSAGASISAEAVDRLFEMDIPVILTAIAFCGAGGTINLTQSNYIKEKRFGMAAFVRRLVNPLALRSAAADRGEAKATGDTRGEGFLYSPSPDNDAKWRRWWREARTEQLINFFAVGSIGLLLLSLIAVQLVGDQEPGKGMDLLSQEMTAATGLWGPAGKLFAAVVMLVFFTSEIGVLDHVARLAANIATVKGVVSAKAGWRTEGAIYLYTLWTMIAAGIFILLVLDIQSPPKLLVIAGCLSGIAMFIYTFALLRLNRAAARQWSRLEPTAALNPFRPPRWRTGFLLIACALFGVMSALAIAEHMGFL
ncbi:MAG: Nramp family divalent metal transporter [Planctomycetota bacterium]|jgi:hypothetical protein